MSLSSVANRPSRSLSMGGGIQPTSSSSTTTVSTNAATVGGDTVTGPKVYNNGGMFVDTWTIRIDTLLHVLRENCNYMSKYHNYKYQYYKERLKWFRIPIIVFSAVNAFIAVGIQSYTAQENISAINSAISLICGVLTSVELFLNIQKKMENELLSHKDYYVLGLDIFKMVSLDVSRRNLDGRAYLDEKYNEYQKLMQNSNIVDIDYYTNIYDLNLDPISATEEGGHQQMVSRFRNTVSEVTNAHTIIKPTTQRIKSGIHKIYDPTTHNINKCRKNTQNNIELLSRTLYPRFSGDENDSSQPGLHSIQSLYNMLPSESSPKPPIIRQPSNKQSSYLDPHPPPVATPPATSYMSQKNDPLPRPPFIKEPSTNPIENRVVLFKEEEQQQHNIKSPIDEIMEVSEHKDAGLENELDLDMRNISSTHSSPSSSPRQTTQVYF